MKEKLSESVKRYFFDEKVDEHMQHSEQGWVLYSDYAALHAGYVEAVKLLQEYRQIEVDTNDCKESAMPIPDRYRMRYEQLVSTPMLSRVPYFHDEEIGHILEVARLEAELREAREEIATHVSAQQRPHRRTESVR